MQPFYFGSSQQQLFGMYHAPEARAARNAAAVLCHPIGHEYLRAHRAFRNLAAALADAGWHVLRFDYLGSGDSGGHDELTTVDQCLADLSNAVQEIKDISGVQKVTLIGLRLGATFAAAAAAQRRDIDRIVLWDPVLRGDSYIAELDELQRRWLEDRMGPRAVSLADGDELIGFRLTDTTRRQLSALTIAPTPKLRTKRVGIFASDTHASYETLQSAFAEAGADATHTVVPGGCEWDRGDAVHQILLPHAMIRTIVAALNS